MKAEPTSAKTHALLKSLSGMYVSAVSDILDDMGLNYQVMNAEIKAVESGTKLLGVALPVETIWYTSIRSTKNFSYGPLFKVFDAIFPGCVVTIAANGRMEAANWGELVSNAARAKGAAGVLSDGCIRDIAGILDISPPFPVFAKRYNPARMEGRAQWGRVNVPVYCGGVKVSPGDIIFGDRDGVIVIPKELADSVVNKALDTVSRETAFRKDIRAGADLRKTIEKYGVA